MVDHSTVMELQRSLPVHSGDVHCIAVHKDVIATTSASSIIRMFNTSDLSEKSYSPLEVHKYHVIHCVITSDGGRLISTSMDGKASIIDISTGKLLAYHQQPNDIGMRICCLSSNDHLLAVGACDGTIAVVEMDTYKTLKTMSVNDDESIMSLCFTPDTHWLLSGHSVTGDIRVFNAQYLSTKPVACQMTAHELGTQCLQMSPKYTGAPGEGRDGLEFASAGADCLICLWSITYNDEDNNTPPRLSKLNTLVGHTAPVYCVKYNRSGDTLASCGGDFTVRLWNLEGECLYVHVAAHSSFINSLAFDSDDIIYTGSCDRTVKQWRRTDTYSLQDISVPISNGLASAPVVLPKDVGPVQTPRNARSKAEVSSWSVDDVCHWLNSLGLSKHTPAFRNNDIDGLELVQLNREVLEKELAIAAYGARNKIMRGLEELASKPPQPEPAHTGDSTHEFVCPITHQIMKDPVVAADGYSYERTAIAAWLSAGKTSSPMTNTPLPADTVLPNHNLRILIEKHAASAP